MSDREETVSAVDSIIEGVWEYSKVVRLILYFGLFVMVFVPSVISFDLFVFVQEDLNCFLGFITERKDRAIWGDLDRVNLCLGIDLGCFDLFCIDGIERDIGKVCERLVVIFGVFWICLGFSMIEGIINEIGEDCFIGFFFLGADFNFFWGL